MMSGLGNVLGNVYGDANDRPKKSDLSDVQDSMDALADVAPDESSTEPDSSESDSAFSASDSAHDAAVEETPALDELSEWVEETGSDDSTHQFGPDADIFESDGLTFLDTDDESPFETAEPFDVDPAAAAPEESAIDSDVIDPEDHSPVRATWLDDLDEPEGSETEDWIGSLPEGAAEEDASTGTVSSLVDSVDDAPGHDSEGPNDSQPETDEATAAIFEATEEATELDTEDEQWLDDLFGVEQPEANANDASKAAHEAPVGATDTPSSHGVLEDEQADSVGADASGPIDADLADLVSNINTDTPSLIEVQDSTSAATTAVENPPAVAVGADWIRSDDDILPTKVRGMRRSKQIELAPAIVLAQAATEEDHQPEPATHFVAAATAEAAADDPIDMFSPVDDDATRSARRFGRKERTSRKAKKSTDLVLSDLDEHAVEAAPTEEPRGLADVISAPTPPRDEDEHLAAAPVIADAGLPAAPAEVDLEDLAEETLDEDVEAAPKKKRFQLPRKNKKSDEPEAP